MLVLPGYSGSNRLTSPSVNVSSTSASTDILGTQPPEARYLGPLPGSGHCYFILRKSEQCKVRAIETEQQTNQGDREERSIGHLPDMC